MRALVLALGASLAATGAGLAQDFGGFRGRGGEPGAFDFYLLALSWSPAFCAGRGSGEGASRAAETQCTPGRGLGFVVHGLWPQYARGYPSQCGAFPRALTGDAVAAAGAIMPSIGLARHEWRVHGTCSGLDPTAYFKAVRQAREAVVIPDAYRKPESEARTTPAEIQRAFADANAGLRADMMSVICRKGRIQEVRICFSKDLKGFTTCPEVARQTCRAGELTLEAAR